MIPSFLSVCLALMVQEAVQVEPAAQDVTPALAEEQRVVFTLRVAPHSFDPVLAVPVIDAVMQNQVLEGLTSYDLAFRPPKIQGQLAKSWTVSEDGLQWDFTLRENLRFYDAFEPPLWPSRSRPLRAQDVLESWLRQADARGPSGGYWTMEGVLVGIEEFRAATAALDPAKAEAAFAQAAATGIAGIQVLSETQLRVRLQRPDPHLLDRFAMPFYGVYPAEAVHAEKRSMTDEPVGSAAFYLANWIPGQQVTLRATPDWRGDTELENDGQPYLQEAQFQVVSEASTAEEMFLRGTSARLSLSPTNAMKFLNDDFSLQDRWAEKGYRLHLVDNLDLTMLTFGMDDPVVGHIPGDEEGNQRRRYLRLAIAHAFPYEAWGKSIREDLPAVAARTFLANGIPGAETLPDISWRKRDLEQAKSYLALAGYPKGKGLEPLEFLLTGTDSWSRSTGTLITSALAEAGIPIKAVPMPFTEQVKRAQNGDAQLFLRAWVPDWPDGALILQNFYGELVGTSVNLGHMADADFDQLFRQYRSLPEGEERNALALALCTHLESLVPALPIDHRRSMILTQPWLGGVAIAVQELFDLGSYRVLAH